MTNAQLIEILEDTSLPVVVAAEASAFCGTFEVEIDKLALITNLKLYEPTTTAPWSEAVYCECLEALELIP